MSSNQANAFFLLAGTLLAGLLIIGAASGLGRDLAEVMHRQHFLRIVLLLCCDACRGRREHAHVPLFLADMEPLSLAKVARAPVASNIEAFDAEAFHV